VEYGILTLLLDHLLTRTGSSERDGLDWEISCQIFNGLCSCTKQPAVFLKVDYVKFPISIEKSKGKILDKTPDYSSNSMILN
jgi:hypothetical protein